MKQNSDQSVYCSPSEICRATLAVRTLSSLEELDLSETGIDDLGLQNLCKARKLKTLNVSYTGGPLLCAATLHPSQGASKYMYLMYHCPHCLNGCVCLN